MNTQVAEIREGEFWWDLLGGLKYSCICIVGVGRMNGMLGLTIQTSHFDFRGIRGFLSWPVGL